MKLARLLLLAFGPFTKKTLDFSAGASNVHVIYGPNEAGKSSALRAMTDLRFGIPPRSPDDFVHPASDLRIGGIFIDQAGRSIGLVRRKGRGATLAGLDVRTEQPDPTFTVDSRLERELTGGLERREFEAMFGLNHARLREGGAVLLSGEGDLGSALFEASAGTSGIAALLGALDADAKKLYSHHGRAQNAVINEARRQLDEQRQIWRQAQTKPAEWQALNRAHETAKAALDDLTQHLEILRRRENELTELRTVEPLLREHDRLAAALQSYAAIPDLSEQQREERLAAEQALHRAQQDLREAESELARCAAALDGLVIEPLLLDHAEVIERLVSGVEAAAQNRHDVHQQHSLIAKIEGELELAVARIAPGVDRRTMLKAVPSSADRAALEGHLADVSLLGERLEGYRERAEALDAALQPAAAWSTPIPDPLHRQSLAAAIREGQAQGDVVRQQRDVERRLREQEGRLAQALSELGVESEEALRRSQPVLEAHITRTKQDLANVEAQLKTRRDEFELVGRDLDGQRLRQRQLAAEGEVVTAETLRQARSRRTEEWASIRRIYIDGTSRTDQLALGFDATKALPETFEASVGEADRQADLLRADTKRAAGLEECSVRIEQMELRRKELDGDMAALRADRDRIQAAWAQHLVRAGLPDLDPESLREWQGRRHEALELVERVTALRVDRDRLLADAGRAAAAIAEGLRAVGLSIAGTQTEEADMLSMLIEQALCWEQSATEAEAEQQARLKTAHHQRIEREKVGRLLDETAADRRRHVDALQAWHARLFLAGDVSPEALKSRLDELDALGRQASVLADAQQRKAQLEAVVDDLMTQATQVAELLGEPVPTILDDFSDRLRKRLAVSRQHQQEGHAVIRDRTRAQEQKRQAAAAQVTEAAVLAGLCARAKGATIDQLPELEEQASKKREVRKSLAMLRQQLTSASARSEGELRTCLAGLDVLALESQRERCRSEIVRLEQEQVSAQRTEEQTRRALEVIDASDRAALAREAMESAAARYRSAIRPWARLKLARALLQEALNRFRERAQAPMVSAASTYFSLMTGGAYDRLVTDERADRPVLCAQRAGGATIGIEEMSEGTADQLYLALRLAALELRRPSHTPMPLVLDDTLITSDDARAANILRALARFAEGSQVMLFTHHRHLLDVAHVALGEQGFVTHHL
ncbi:MAG: AAA family ATPase [Nitrospira sp.]|nr:AAA family ATPase [Nitrospira sp.]